MATSSSDIVKAIKTDKDRLPKDRKEDLEFLRDQMGPRLMTLGSRDSRRVTIIARREMRAVTSLPKVSAVSIPLCDQFQMDTAPQDQSFEEPDKDDNDFSLSPEKSKMRQGSQTIEVTREAIEDTMRAAISLDVSAHKMTALLTKFISASKGDPATLPLSYSSAYKMKDKIINKESEDLKIIIHNEIKKHGVAELHFDGKLIQVTVLIEKVGIIIFYMRI